jgi:hypothetical protein
MVWATVLAGFAWGAEQGAPAQPSRSEAAVLEQIRQLIAELLTQQEGMRQDLLRLEEYRAHIRRAERLEDRVAELTADLVSAEEAKQTRLQEIAAAARSADTDELRKQWLETQSQLDSRIASLREARDRAKTELAYENDKSDSVLKDMRGRTYQNAGTGRP